MRSTMLLSTWSRNGEGRYDLVYCNGTNADFAGGFLAKSSGVPALWHVRYTSLPPAVRGVHDAPRGQPRRPKRIVCVSAASAELFPHCREKVRVIHNALDTEEFNAKGIGRRRWKRDLGLPPDAVVFGSQGRILPRKGYVEMIHAARTALAAMTEDEKRRAFFAVLGDTPEDYRPDHLTECRALVTSLGLDSKFKFLGFCADVKPYSADFDVAVVPSIYADPLPRAVIESSALGKPVDRVRRRRRRRDAEGRRHRLAREGRRHERARARAPPLSPRSRPAPPRRHGRSRADRDGLQRRHPGETDPEPNHRSSRNGDGVVVASKRSEFAEVSGAARPLRRATEAIVDFASRRPWTVILLSLFAIACANVYIKSRLELRSDFLELLPRDSPGFIAYEHQLGRVGGASTLFVIVESPDRAANEAFVDDLSVELKKLPPNLVSYVEDGSKKVREYLQERTSGSTPSSKTSRTPTRSSTTRSRSRAVSSRTSRTATTGSARDGGRRATAPRRRRRGRCSEERARPRHGRVQEALGRQSGLERRLSDGLLRDDRRRHARHSRHLTDDRHRRSRRRRSALEERRGARRGR